MRFLLRPPTAAGDAGAAAPGVAGDAGAAAPGVAGAPGVAADVVEPIFRIVYYSIIYIIYIINYY